MNDALRNQIVADLHKSREHLQYSYNKVITYDFSTDFSEDELEVLESFSSRFARFSDLVIAKYFRYLAKETDPAFRGSVIDLLNLAEKSQWIGSAQDWRRIRELRNQAAHEYTPSDYKKLYRELITLTSHLLNLSLSL